MHLLQQNTIHQLPAHVIPRRALVAATIAAVALPVPQRSQAGAVQELAGTDDGTTFCNDQLSITSKAFLDVSISGELVGRVTVGLFGYGAPQGTARFMSLVTGVGFRRKEFTKVMPNYVQHGGVVSYAAVPEVLRALEEEKEAFDAKCSSRGAAVGRGMIGIVIRDPGLPPPRPKIVARGGKLQMEEEQLGVVPNATEFVIATADAPELAPTVSVIGRVVDGMDVVDRMASVPTVKENSSSPYFRVAKLIGDKRAVVAERGFNRPYTKIVVVNCGLID